MIYLLATQSKGASCAMLLVFVSWVPNEELASLSVGFKYLILNVESLLVYASVHSLRAVVVWQSLSLVDKYKHPNTSFTVSVSNARDVGRFNPVGLR